MLVDKAILAVANAIFYAGNSRLVLRYLWRLGRWPNIAWPQLYSERMLWRKIVDHNPQFVLFSDKLATKDYIKRLCPELSLPRTLWIGSAAQAIPEELLQGDVYVKANHGCNFHCRIRFGQWDRADLQKKTLQWLSSVYGARDGEWSYSKVEPKLFVEEAVGDAEADLIEFNVRACNGRMILSSVLGYCKTPRQWTVYLDAAGNPVPGMTDPEGAPVTPLPPGLNLLEPYLRAVRFAERMSVGVDYVRSDFMWNGSELFGGEITVYPAGGLAEPANASCNNVTLQGWDLLQSHFLKAAHAGWRRIYAEALRRRLSERASAPSY